MIGAVVYKLRAENSARLPIINGRLMHAAFFQILNELSPELGNFVHGKLNMKPFTVSFLQLAEKIPCMSGHLQISRGDKFLWRVTALNEKILNAAMSIPADYKIRVGSLNLRAEILRGESIPIEDFISRAKNFPHITEICFDFVSPVSFRIDDFDAPYPRAELIFSSLADKWTQAQMPAACDKKIIHEIASHIRLTQWQGESKKFYFGHDRGILAFSGKFSFNVEALSDDLQRVFILLAEFGEFAGVGRLTGQGFGQVRVSCFS